MYFTSGHEESEQHVVHFMIVHPHQNIKPGSFSCGCLCKGPHIQRRHYTTPVANAGFSIRDCLVGGFLTIEYCSRTIGYCLRYCFWKIFVGGQGFDGGGKVVMGESHQGKS